MVRGGDRIRMPASTAGITQYWDDVKTKVEMKPEHVIVLAVIIIIIELLLQAYGSRIFG
ncbi:preprotein translocase subunit Sec61beta [Candidatus Woesearchaeota archaeon]|nr:MAG: preprotein translocase subunit Sec61beta [Candidatus Woesearchaeota archaeon]